MTHAYAPAAAFPKDFTECPPRDFGTTKALVSLTVCSRVHYLKPAVSVHVSDGSPSLLRHKLVEKLLHRFVMSFVVHAHENIGLVRANNRENTLRCLLLPAQCAKPSADSPWLHSLLLQKSCIFERLGPRGRHLKWEKFGALGPTASHVGALLDEAVDDDAVAVDRCVLVVERVD
ncbi:unnamed protein product, partial [Ectocarpus sp. 12 AP-2014]